MRSIHPKVTAFVELYNGMVENVRQQLHEGYNTKKRGSHHKMLNLNAEKSLTENHKENSLL